MNAVVISNVTTEIIYYQSTPVVTTKQLAEFYGCDEKAIRQNFNNNKEHFDEGKHFIKLIGKQVSEFISLSNISTKLVSPNAPTLMLWTAKGAARHAKMLSTEKAWEVFEQLEDAYFKKHELQQKLPVTYLEALKELVTVTELAESQAKQIEVQKQTIENKDDLIRVSNEASVKAGEILIREFVKSQDLITLGEKQFFQWMRDQKIIFSDHNEPYQQYVNAGYFTYKPSEIKYGGKFRYMLRVTPRGKVWLAAKYMAYLDTASFLAMEGAIA